MAEKLRRGHYDDTMSFELFNAAGKRIILKGAYVIVDNGYLQWSVSVPPFKDSCSRKEVRFSKWLESLRKDVECTFGILKSRWRILKTGIRLHNTEVADRVWVTCCALLHNMLLNVDGLSNGWEHGVPSFWEVGGNGQFEVCDLPQAVRTLIGNQENPLILGMDKSKFGGYVQHRTTANNCDDNDDKEPDMLLPDNLTSGPISVSSLSLKQFRSLLVDNFVLLFPRKTREITR